jgi:polyisoprenoid-binding protein YceI
MKTSNQLVLTATSLLFVACENPADKTTSASVTDAVETQAATPADAAGTRYTFSASSEIHFIGSKVTGSHHGGFKSFQGEFSVANGALTGSGQTVVIDMASTWADDEKLTGHLKSPDFFNVAKFPQSTFTLTKLEKKSETEYQVSGNLTLTGTTKNITFPATVTQTGDAVGINAKFDINRKDFGIIYAGMADNLIKDEVVIELKLQAVPKA